MTFKKGPFKKRKKELTIEQVFCRVYEKDKTRKEIIHWTLLYTTNYKCLPVNYLLHNVIIFMDIKFEITEMTCYDGLLW